MILDGWGHGPMPQRSAIAQAHTPYMDSLYGKYPNSELVTFGEEVGLPEGQMGNSEVGHQNIGAGRIVYQELARINVAIRSGEFQKNHVLNAALKKAAEKHQKVHLFGLVSDGGVHSHLHHLYALIDLCESHQLKQVNIHAFMDGRDTDPKGGQHYIKELQAYIIDKSANIASIIGRYYAMDRDKRWERVKLAYDLMVHGEGKASNFAPEAIAQSYADGVTDEFIKPIVMVDDQGEPVGAVEEGDLLICFNFRTDRPRQIVQVLTQTDFPDFSMYKLDHMDLVTMTEYDKTFQNVQVVFSTDNLVNTLGEWLAHHGLKQVRIAETEKYPHVTYFFSGGREHEFKGEKRLLIPSPKVPTYDLQPEMSAHGITEAIIAEIKTNAPHFICLNFANTDMVGHTGVFSAAVKAAETVDACVSRIVPVAIEHDYSLVIIADHGNSDYMINDDGTPNTAHTKNPVPCIIIDPRPLSVKPGKLADIAPTLLHLMGIQPPLEMTGTCLVDFKG